MEDATIAYCDDLDKAQETAKQAAKVFNSGGLVVFPTETVYGIAASSASEKGIKALRQFKDRLDTQPFGIHLPDPGSAERYVNTGTPMVGRMIRKVFPGPVTLIVDVSDEVIDCRLRALKLTGGVNPRLYHNNTVGLRCPDHSLARQILGSVADPIIASSANRRGQLPPHNAQEAAEAVQNAADLIVDGGPCRFSKPSTIVRLRSDDDVTPWVVEREGVYDQRFIEKLMHWNLLLVCSGNTCRSPMAATLAESILAQRRGIAVDQLNSVGLHVSSAGVFAAEGMPANEEAVIAMRKRGLNLSRHQSQPLSIEMVDRADVVYCMTKNQHRELLQMAPAAADKVMLLDPNGEVDDPIGSGQTAYQRCAELIRRRLAQRLREQQL